MSDNEKKSIANEKQKPEIWQGRYNVYAVVERFNFKSYFYKDVVLKFFQSDIPVAEVDTLLKPFGLSCEGMGDGSLIYHYVAETFTEEQAIELINYLKNHRGIEASKQVVLKPNKNSYGVSFLAVGGHDDFYMLSGDTDYNLSFNAWYYVNVAKNDYLGRTPEEADLRLVINEKMKRISFDELQELDLWLKNKIDKEKTYPRSSEKSSWIF